MKHWFEMWFNDLKFRECTRVNDETLNQKKSRNIADSAFNYFKNLVYNSIKLMVT